MVDPGIHAEMTILVRRENELRKVIDDLEHKDIPVWERRVELALQKGMNELADEAEARLHELRKKASDARLELDAVDMRKSMLRYESKRPAGREVERSQALLDSIRLAGLVDPDRSDFENLEARDGLPEESGTLLDFGTADEDDGIK